MQVFVTGATGFIGARVVDQLLAAGHQVVGMTRSDAGAAALSAAGAQPYRAELDDVARIVAGAAQADAVIHTAFNHDDFGKFVESCAHDGRLIAAMGEALRGSARPLIITSGVGMGERAHGEPALETVLNREHRNPRIASELAGMAALEAGVDLRVVRLPQVHDTRKQGLVTYLIQNSREKGVSAYIGDGQNRWSAGHLGDVALLYRLALEKGRAGERYHAVGEEGVTARAIAEVVGKGLGVPVQSISPEQAGAHFGWLGMFAGVDMAASSALTRERLGWQPVGPGLIADLQAMDYALA
ncbi:nucleoside-diphosphate-sugar epimerase [Duganella sp. 1224]|uniref:SDR family oxidoreductase n=1 Tax=Duganella sp. 1224 TaxID=2587052 RepID=UPI0015CB061A|nr:SDR family oxidoreductase [Duganella sp. 1224]NYE61556.1 nucleoside-diphosphate-sugar epimerase [Duganella sp. 1224]